MGHVPDQNLNQNPDSGRHRVDGDFEYYESIEESTPGGAAAGAATAGTATASGDSNGPIPLRGLAMVLIFIAILLVGWAFYSMFSGSGDDAAAGNETVVVEEEQAPAPQDPAPGAEAPGNDEAPLPDENDTNNADNDAPAEVPEPAGPAPADRGSTNVLVLNNSTSPGWADETGGDLGQQGWANVNGGNLSRDNTGITAPTVFFDPGNDAQRVAAEEIARDNGWVTQPRNDVLNGQPMDSVIVVVAGER